MKKTVRCNVVVTRSRDDGWWCGHLETEPGVLTQGKTLAQVMERIEEAYEAFYGRPPIDIEFVLRPRLPGKLSAQVREALMAAREAKIRQAKAQALLEEAARSLTGTLGVSTRDASKLLGVSHQRISQLAT